MGIEKKKIYIKCQNGIDFKSALANIFWELSNELEFIESDQPDFILFGPYGNDVPKKGSYTRIGYFCENIIPDMSTCEWGFGIPRTEEVNHPKYARIQWHGFNPNQLIKNLSDNDIDFIINQKQQFCNFFYSHPVPYREHFFKQLSKYKKIDAPGKSMRNMPSIDDMYVGNMWERKRQFLSQYKFTIAFENYVYPGYQTEKLYDAMLCNSIPIYCGDLFVDKYFNTQSFINAPDYIPITNNLVTQFLERNSQMSFIDILPQFYHGIGHRIIRKAKSLGRNAKMKIQFNKLNFEPVIEKIIEVDQNPELYISYLKQPWLNGNSIPFSSTLKNRWLKIFNNPTQLSDPIF